MKLTSIVIITQGHGIVELELASEEEENSTDNSIDLDAEKSYLPSYSNDYDIIDLEPAFEGDDEELDDMDTVTYDVVELELASATEVNNNEAEMTQEMGGNSTSTSILATKGCCCVNRCLACFSILEMEHINTLFKAKSAQEQSQYLLDSMTLTRKFSLLGREICTVAIRRLLSVSTVRIQKVQELFDLGVKTTCKPKKRERRVSHKSTMMVAWLESYASMIGDKMPHIQQVHLPTCLTKKTVYRIMAGMLEEFVQTSCKPHNVNLFLCLKKDVLG